MLYGRTTSDTAVSAKKEWVKLASQSFHLKNDVLKNKENKIMVYESSIHGAIIGFHTINKSLILPFTDPRKFNGQSSSKEATNEV